MSNENNTTTSEKRKPQYIEVTEHDKFEKLAATSLETTQRLAKRINKLFSVAFVDYYGAAIYCLSGNGNSGPQFMVEIHFKPLAAGYVNPNDARVRAFKPIEEKSSSDIVSNLKSIYGNLRTSAKFELTKDAAEILSEFMTPGCNIDPFNPASYNNFKQEYVEGTQFGQGPAMVKIFNLSLDKLVRKIYGNKNEDGKRVEYGVIPYGPVNPSLNNSMMQNNANWRVVIMQIEAEKTRDLATEFGLIPASNGSNGPIVTGTI